MLDISPLSEMSLANAGSHSMACLSDGRHFVRKLSKGGLCLGSEVFLVRGRVMEDGMQYDSEIRDRTGGSKDMLYRAS